MKPCHGIDIQRVLEAAKKIRFLALDVDGVMTDGGLYYSESGLAMKRFDVHDGIGIRIWKSCGFEVAVLSGMDVPCVRTRLDILNITLYAGGHDNKVSYLEKFRKDLSLEWNEIAYLGDDWVDMAPMLKVGLPVAVSNATPDTKDVALAITRRKGGHGAIRELVEFILEAQDKKKKLLEDWRGFE